MGGHREKYFYEFRGKTWTRKELADYYGVPKKVLAMRLLRNNDVLNDHVLRPFKLSKHKHFLTDYDGLQISVSDFCRRYEISYRAIMYRYKDCGCRNLDILRKPSYCLETGDLKK